MRNFNPALKEEAFASDRSYRSAELGTMTIDGTVNKTGILLFLLILSAGWVWAKAFSSTHFDQDTFTMNIPAIMPYMIFGGISGFIIAMVTIFKQNLSPITAPLYAICEGLFLGGLSATFEMRFPGIVMQATGLTFATLFALLGAYKAGWIQVTEKFQSTLLVATGAIGVVYLVNFVMSFFGAGIPYIHDSGMIGIGFSLVVVGIAAMNLVMDFHFITQNARYGAPKYMEWYAGFGLLVTLVWLYVEVLRLLSKLNQKEK